MKDLLIHSELSEITENLTKVGNEKPTNTTAADAVAQEWTHHATGVIAPEEAHTDWKPGQWPPAGAEPVDIEGFYARMAASGLVYGPSFEGLRATLPLDDDVG